MRPIDMSEHRPVSVELHHEIERFLHKEARLLDREMQREWLDTMVDRDIRYQMVIREDRLRRDRSKAVAKEIFPYDDDHEALELRVRQFETGLQTMLDPPPRMRRIVSNIEAFHGAREGDYLALSYGIVFRSRRLYEHEQAVFGREDVLRRSGDGGLRLLSRRIDMDERVVRNKNLLFFL
jgi:3-phenylpropionate/cinnamic acid dioxygenase small subunit